MYRTSSAWVRLARQRLPAVTIQLAELRDALHTGPNRPFLGILLNGHPTPAAEHSQSVVPGVDGRTPLAASPGIAAPGGAGLPRRQTASVVLGCHNRYRVHRRGASEHRHPNHGRRGREIARRR